LPKTRFSAVVSTFVVCYGFWLLLTWSVDPEELIAGAVVSAAVALFSARFFIHDKSFWFFNPKHLFALFAYIFVLLWEIVKANVDMAKRCYGGCKNVNPGIVKIPVDLKSDYAQSMLANSITLTPGTISLDIAEEAGQTYYYVHWIDVTEEDRVKAGEIIKGKMEKWIRRIWE